MAGITRPTIPFFWKIFGAVVVPFLLITTLSAFLLNASLEKILLDNIKQDMQDQATLFLHSSLTALTNQDFAQIQSSALAIGNDTHLRVTLIRRDGVVMAESSQDPSNLDNHGERPEVTEASLTGTAFLTRPSTTIGKSMLYCRAYF